MPRPPRLYLESAVDYVTLDGPFNEPIFRDHEDYQKYLDLLNHYRDEFNFKLFAYVLTPRRLHLLMEVSEEAPISQVMLQITPHYTKYFNSRYQRKGSLFPKRFHSMIVEKESYLPRLTRYIHMIPCGIEGVAGPQEYPYSSYSSYLKTQAEGGGRMDLRQEIAEVLGCLSDAPVSLGGYEQYVLSAGEEEMRFLNKKLSRGYILGSEAFTERVHLRMKKEDSLDGNGSCEQVELRHEEEEPVTVVEAPLSGFRLNLLGVMLTGTVIFSAFAVHLNHRTQVLMPTPVVKNHSTTASANQATPSAKSLDGAIFEIELLAVAEDGTTKPIKDKIKFVGKSFESHYFSSQGFLHSNYTVTVQENGTITWETMQTNPKGEVVSWRGDWAGSRMEGMTSYQPAGQVSQDFSFMSQGATR